MGNGVLKRECFTLGEVDFYVDYQDNSYYGEKGYKFYIPSTLNDDCWGFDFTKQFKSFEKCKNYMNKCISKTCKQILLYIHI